MNQRASIAPPASRLGVEPTATRNDPARVFVVVVLGSSLAISALVRGSGPLAPMLTMITPALAYFAATSRSGRGGRETGLRRAGVTWWPAAMVIPALIGAGAYGIAAALGLARVPELRTGIDPVLNLVIGLAIGTLLALGEEIGWRGFLLREFGRTRTPARAALLTGFVHGLWHLPLLLLTTAYDTDGRRWIVAPLVVLTVTLAGPFYALLRTRSRSLWPVALAHSAFNTTIETARRVIITSSPAALAYAAGEAGLVTIALLVPVAMLSCRSLRQAP